MKTKIFIILFSILSICVETFAQTRIFYDDFGTPGPKVEKRQIWSYMPVGINTFIFADPNASNVGGKSFSEAKAIENNFYAVVCPKNIYSSAGELSAVPPYTASVYPLWPSLQPQGDITPGHNGNGGAMVINAGTTLAAFYVRIANLQAGKYYRLRYQLFVQNEKVKINHYVLSSSGGTAVATYEGPNNGQGDGVGKWKQQDYWFFMPEGCSGNYTISIQNAHAADSGNDFAIDDLLFEMYEPDEVDSSIKNSLPENSIIHCDMSEPTAVDDEFEVNCNHTGKLIVDVLANDKNEIGALATPENFKIRLDVPVGAKHTLKDYDGDWSTNMSDQVFVPGIGTWNMEETRSVKWNDAIGGPAYSDYKIEVSFQPTKEYTGNPSPISYRLYNRKTNVGSNRAFVRIFSDCNPRAVDDIVEVEEINSQKTIEIDILANDKPANHPVPIDPSNVKNVTLINPNTLIPFKSGSMTVDGEGEWKYTDGKLIFTSFDGFTKEPTPINYTFTDTDDNTSNTAKVTIRQKEIVIADLSIKKIVNTSSPSIGDEVTFTITINNEGLNSAYDIQVTDVLESGYDFVSSEGANYDKLTKKIIWSIDYLNEGKSIDKTLIAKVRAEGIYDNTVVVSSLTKDSNLDNNTSTVKVTPIKENKNYWYGTEDNEWNKTINWTGKIIPKSGENIEFATEENNNGEPAINDLHLDTDRVIGDLINKSDKNLLIHTGKQLIIEGKVTDDSSKKGTIVVKTSSTEPTGTLIFTNPASNLDVSATVEFYNKAYECSTCGFFRKQWQYFGIPVNRSDFPYSSPKVETINQWVEPYRYNNKWQPAPYAPDTLLTAFKGYEMTNSINSEPTNIYSFSGILYVGDALIAVTKTSGVDYSGMNLIANSYTAAIPISTAAIDINGTKLKTETVYLFNTGTRDQWRKLNGATRLGIAAGQYQAVPFNLAGEAGIPDRILSMNTFMLDIDTSGDITLNYDQLIKNELNESTTKPWKSTNLRSGSLELPRIIIDVISEESADRVWLFEKEDATKNFDNGWDGYKIKEGELIQAYVVGEDQTDYQIATIPQLDGTVINIQKDRLKNFFINLSVSSEIETKNLFLHDALTGSNYPIENGAEYQIRGSNNTQQNRFKIVTSASTIEEEIADYLIDVYVQNNDVVINNQTNKDCNAIIYDLMGRIVSRKLIQKNDIVKFNKTTSQRSGIYIVKVTDSTGTINKVSRVLLK